MPLLAFYLYRITFILIYCNLLPTIHFPLSLINIGGDKRVRTADLCLARAALSQLSYIPKTYMVGMAGLEPATPALSAQCSNHLSYTPTRYIEETVLEKTP